MTVNPISPEEAREQSTNQALLVRKLIDILLALHFHTRFDGWIKISEDDFDVLNYPSMPEFGRRIINYFDVAIIASYSAEWEVQRSYDEGYPQGRTTLLFREK